MAKKLSEEQKEKERKSDSARWCLSSTPMKASLEVELSNGKSYKYRSTNYVDVGDYILIERGFKSSGQIGKVKKVLDLSATTKSHTALAQYSFCENPTPEMIKKNASKIIDLDSFDVVNKKFKIDGNNFAYVDKAVDVLLNAATVLAFPEYSSKAAIKKATSCLHEKKTVPAFLYGESMIKGVDNYIYFCILKNEKYYNFFPPQFYMIYIPRVYFTGFYPKWEKPLYSLSTWKELKAIGKKLKDTTYNRNIALDLLKKYDIDIYIWDDIKEIWDDITDYDIGVFEQDNNSILGCMNSEFEDFVNNDKQYHEVCNEIIFRSALSILIKGNFTNLLEAFLSANPPIEKFCSDLIAYAKTCKSDECAKILKKYFD